ncbi:unnamed protein product [Rotaria sp. Silwood2]|nr:unnamed protein product [Rotaria sp. Silwood2]
MSGSTNYYSVLDRIDEELADKNVDVKNILHDVYESQITFLIEQKQHDKSKRLADLFNQLIDLLIDSLYSTSSSVDDTQIDSILNKIKSDINTWREKWSTSVVDVNQFEKAFDELVRAIEDGFCMMSRMFKHVTAKIQKVEKNNKDLKNEVENLTLMEQKRTQKEKLFGKKILIRDLLILGRDRLVEEYNHRELSRDKFGIYYDKEIDIKKLQNKHRHMYDVLNDVAKEFTVDSDKFLMLLREKRHADGSVHIYRDIQEYALAHKMKQDFDLNQFLKQQGSLVVTGDCDGVIHFFNQELKLHMWFEHFRIGPIQLISFTYTRSDSIYALDTHPFQHKLCFTNASGRSQLWDYQEKVIITSLQRTHDKAVTQLRYNHNGNFIAIGYTNGQLTLCDALSLESIVNVPFPYAKTAILFIQFSPKSIYLAISEDNYTVSVYRQNLSNDDLYTFVGRYRAHYKLIRALFF